MARRSRVGEGESISLLGRRKSPSSGAARHLLPDGEKNKTSAPYSRASASTGSIRAAERAGMKPKITPIRLAEAIATMIDSAE